MARITIVPTSHIAMESIRLIRETVEKEKPDCIAVELDMNRYRTLREGEASLLDSLRALGLPTFLFYFVLKNLQQSLGRMVGVSPGSEMLEAVRVGQQNGIYVAFIDRDIGDTLLRIKDIPAKEKVRLLTFVLRALLPSTWSKSLLLKSGSAPSFKRIDLSKVPPEEIVNTAIELLRKEFPRLYRILIEERNLYMAQRIKELSSRFQNIVIVVGAGHAKGIAEILKEG
jgi:pheromone shutdown-related protein TraB